MDYHISVAWILLVALLAIWELVWKGFALWRASKNNHLEWFIVLLIINSAGILPIMYVLLHKDAAKKYTNKRIQTSL